MMLGRPAVMGQVNVIWAKSIRSLIIRRRGFAVKGSGLDDPPAIVVAEVGSFVHGQCEGEIHREKDRRRLRLTFERATRKIGVLKGLGKQ